jgi:hypothetical protein
MNSFGFRGHTNTFLERIALRRVLLLPKARIARLAISGAIHHASQRGNNRRQDSFPTGRTRGTA